MKYRTYFALTVNALFSSHLYADHGRDYLLLQDANIGEPLSGSLHSTIEWADHSDKQEWNLETGGMFSITKDIGAGLSVSLTDLDDSWKYNSLTPYVLLDLMPEKSRIRLALYAGYEFGENDESGASAHSHVETHSHGARRPTGRSSARASNSAPVHKHSHSGSSGHVGARVGCGPEYGPDAPPCDEANDEQPHDHSTHDHGTPSTNGKTTKLVKKPKKEAPNTQTASHKHRGGHRHGETAFHARLILEADLTTADKLVFNLIHMSPKEGKPAWGYAAGFRHRFHHDFALGVEATGDFDEQGEHLIVGGAYFSPLHHLTLKFGLGFGLTEQSPDTSILTSAVWKF